MQSIMCPGLVPHGCVVTMGCSMVTAVLSSILLDSHGIVVKKMQLKVHFSKDTPWVSADRSTTSPLVKIDHKERSRTWKRSPHSNKPSGKIFLMQEPMSNFGWKSTVPTTDSGSMSCHSIPHDALLVPLGANVWNAWLWFTPVRKQKSIQPEHGIINSTTLFCYFFSKNFYNAPLSQEQYSFRSSES